MKMIVPDFVVVEKSKKAFRGSFSENTRKNGQLNLVFVVVLALESKGL